ncbi:MAG: hypothetical protein QOH21_3240 [Acidobacteriota bacterium]|jgi:DNA-binding beta-propeller fold protein YncE|nr:hypothetical protein [Acidobacteriota bacterium]
MRKTVVLLALLVSATGMLAADGLPPLPHSPDLFVSGFFAASIERYYGPRSSVTGPHAAPAETAAVYSRNVVRRPWGLAFGPDGNLYVANVSGATPGLARVNGPFSASPGAWTALADGAFNDVAFGPDGNLYAAGHGAVRRYDVVTGAWIDEFTTGYPLTDARGIAFGPDGKLYVGNYDGCVTGPTGCTGTRGEVVRFDALTGKFVDVYLPSGTGGLQWPWKVAFDPTGALLVVNWTVSGNNNVLRFPASQRSPSAPVFTGRGTRSAAFLTRDGWFPLYVAVGPDGQLYVSASNSAGDAGDVLRFDGRTGAFIDVFVANVDGGPRGIAFAPGSH